MLKQLFKQKWYIIGILVLIIIEPSINSVLNFWLKGLFNAASPGAEKIAIIKMLTYGFLLWMVKRLVSFTSGVLKNRFICNAKQEIKHKLFTNLLKLDTSNIANIASSGEYISLFTNDINIIETRFYNQIVGLISSVFSILILGTSFFALNAKLALAIILFGIVSMVVPVAFSKKLNQKNLVYSDRISKFTQRMKEYMVAYPTIKNYSIEKKISEKFDYVNSETEEAKFEADYTLTLANNVGQLLSWFMQFIGVGLGLMLVIKGEILIGTVVAAQSFASDLANPLQNIIISINSIRSVKEIVSKIERLSRGDDSEEQSENANENIELSECSKYDIVFENFSLYLTNKCIVDDFSFSFESGKKYLIVGLNGSGKSTIFKTLKKWYKVSSGSIRINDVDVGNISSDNLSKYVSYLNEGVSLFTGSVKDNISLFRDYNPDLFDRAIKDANVDIDLNREVGDEGRNISSGEQRRIEIARSLLGSVKVLVFDEVVSTLDIETAYNIEKMALEFKDKTVIFISHNFSGKLIDAYDEILVMDKGKLLAHGSYKELINTSEYFRKICDIKFGR